ncbi:MAG: hypothetical protein LAT62_01930 [Natronospirillum sp.]|uniref:hypothetical protein n=1 Tax=Natronospirillum sp. TaxID=2812955 RepID=UPI0025F55E3F|nr:hypothetical protein [Natronospirillum sp.]MCH8550664.1 hypothetical protein [Natronospirillum sp.]
MFAMSLAGLALVGCATSTAEYRNQAVASALSTEAELRAWVAACTEVSGEAAAAARNADRVWWERNEQLLRAADYGFTRELQSFGDERREESLALFTMRAGDALDRQQKEAVAERLEGRNAERTCVRHLADFEAGDRDLSQDRDHYSALVALANEGGLDLEPAERSRQPQLPSDNYGRSYFQAEEALGRQGCQQPEIQLLKADWPREIYEAQCSDRRYQLVSCEWNRCDIF